jgi:hypothetical protein
MNSTKQGFFITARDAEKFLSASTIIFNTIYTGSFLPADPSSVTACDSRGTAYLYAFDLDCGVGKFTSEPGTAQDKRRKAIGSGLPTRPRVSIGEVNQGGGGGGGGGCNNRLVVVTSDGGIYNESPGCSGKGNVKVRSWRER